ncbi:MAG: hypothetical protein ABWX92_14460 [Mycetocola sp.]
MTRYRQSMLPSTRRPPAGAAWITTGVAGALAIVLGVAASFHEVQTASANVLWVAALVFATVALLAWYALAIHWARRRKRLWG